MSRRKNWPRLIVWVWLWALGSLACSSFSVSLDQATLQIAVPTPAPTKMQLPPDATLFDVQADSGWQDTGLQLKAGQQVQIAYVSGYIADQGTVVDDGNGWNYVCGRTGCCEPLPTVRRSALIGQVGRQIFFIGNGGVFSALTDGRLLLRINDCDEGLYDNSGSLKVGFQP